MTNIISDIVSDTHLHGIDIKNREIFLHNFNAGEDNPGVDYRMAHNFIKNIRILENISKEAILIHLHSIGGSWNDGIAIFDAIKSCECYITILVHGQAESMSSVILQAADFRVMMPNAYFMCHYGSTEVVGNHLDVHNYMMHEKDISENMFQIYAEKCINGEFFKNKYKTPTVDKVKIFLKNKFKNGDWYLNSQDAINYGFADSILVRGIKQLK
jgi:ATP-dependent protease ClpP protease subunit